MNIIKNIAQKYKKQKEEGTQNTDGRVLTALVYWVEKGKMKQEHLTD